jgi:hypothetical protein
VSFRSSERISNHCWFVYVVFDPSPNYAGSYLVLLAAPTDCACLHGFGYDEARSIR